MRWTKRILEHGEEVLAQVLRFEHPADAVLSHYFRDHRTLGHGERGMIADTVYAVLRRLRTLEAAAGVTADSPWAPRRLMLAAIVRLQGMNLRQLEPVLQPEEALVLGKVKGLDLATLSPAARADQPDWLHERLVAQYGEAGAAALAEALNRSAPLDLRVNTLKADRARVLERLAADGIAAQATALSPVGIRLGGKPALARHPLFLGGDIEVQDEGSQLLGYLLAPKRGEMVVDFCAGAGGKTLLLGALMRSQGRLYAFDVSDRRLANLKPRLARSGLSNVHPVRIADERDMKIKRLAGKIDRVLVDAPCSGLGTLRRNPDLKWRQTPEAVARLQATQSAILASAATLLKPGGRLVYATCSVLQEENDAVVDGFLAAHPQFEAIDASAVLARQDIVVGSGPRLRLSPAAGGTDGFFAAVVERRA